MDCLVCTHVSALHEECQNCAQDAQDYEGAFSGGKSHCYHSVFIDVVRLLVGVSLCFLCRSSNFEYVWASGADDEHRVWMFYQVRSLPQKCKNVRGRLDGSREIYVVDEVGATGLLVKVLIFVLPVQLPG